MAEIGHLVRRGDEVRLARDGNLSFQAQQVAPGGAIHLALLGGGVAAVAIGDVRGQ